MTIQKNTVILVLNFKGVVDFFEREQQRQEENTAICTFTPFGMARVWLGYTKVGFRRSIQVSSMGVRDTIPSAVSPSVHEQQAETGSKVGLKLGVIWVSNVPSRILIGPSLLLKFL